MILYKFLGSKRAISVLSEGKIRFAQLSSLNDPFESFPSVDGFVTRDWVSEIMEFLLTDESIYSNMIENAVSNAYQQNKLAQQLYPDINEFSVFIKNYVHQEFSKKGINLKDFMRNYFNDNIDALTSNLNERIIVALADIVCVLSLSAAKSNHLMWSHYADSHSGVAIGFEHNNPYFIDAMTVIYRSERPTLDFLKLPTIDNEKQALARNILAIKNISWNYEEEYRLIKPSINLERLNDSDSKGYPVFVSEFPSESVSQIIYGCKISKDDQTAINKLVLNKYQNVNQYNSIISSKDYQISFKEFT